MEGFAEELLDWIAGLGGGTLHAIVFLLAFGETAFFTDLFIPGETGMVVVGAAASRNNDPLPTLILAATLGAVLGDSVSFWIGRKFGLRLIRKWGPVRRRLEPGVAKAQRYFEERGGAAVFLGRWVGIVRGVIPVVAGMENMPYKRFLAWNVLASVTWTAAILTAGFYLGRHIEGVVSRAGLIVTGVVMLAGIVLWVVLRRRRRNREPSPQASRSDSS
jgi:membrane-associated protein